jgi:predicted GNAT family N-acyltransferase
LSYRVEIISAEQTRPVRHEILRPGMPVESLIYPGDDNPATFHMGAFDSEGALVCILSMYAEPAPGTTSPGWRIRGMATLPEHRSLGLGARLVKDAISQSHSSQVAPVWCNARTSAAGYYAKLGFTQLGDEFEVEGIGPHFVMVRDCDA